MDHSSFSIIIQSLIVQQPVLNVYVLEGTGLQLKLFVCPNTIWPTHLYCVKWDCPKCEENLNFAFFGGPTGWGSSGHISNYTIKMSIVLPRPHVFYFSKFSQMFTWFSLISFEFFCIPYNEKFSLTLNHNIKHLAIIYRLLKTLVK